jgi:excinuclease ABC subunit A
MESLSTQARQVLDQLKRPDVDFIHGLSPVLAIEQRTGGVSPRTTIATVTEVADYSRLLWALGGGAALPEGRGRVVRRSLDDNVGRILCECAGRAGHDPRAGPARQAERPARRAAAGCASADSNG